jgi:hypothetical protein
MFDKMPKKELCYVECCVKWFTYYSNALDLFLEIIIVELGLNICLHIFFLTKWSEWNHDSNDHMVFRTKERGRL